MTRCVESQTKTDFNAALDSRHNDVTASKNVAGNHDLLRSIYLAERIRNPVTKVHFSFCSRTPLLPFQFTGLFLRDSASFFLPILLAKL